MDITCALYIFFIDFVLKQYESTELMPWSLKRTKFLYNMHSLMLSKSRARDIKKKTIQNRLYRFFHTIEKRKLEIINQNVVHFVEF